jgi:hypothetical protein
MRWWKTLNSKGARAISNGRGGFLAHVKEGFGYDWYAVMDRNTGNAIHYATAEGALAAAKAHLAERDKWGEVAAEEWSQ